jgi:hypothetical protein
MEYWIIVDNRHAGPYSARQLLDAGLTADTLVWHEGLTDWTRAADVAELAEGLAAQANPAPEPQTASWQQPASTQGRDYGYSASSAGYNTSATNTSGYAPSNEATGYRGSATPESQGNDSTPTGSIVDEPCPPAYMVWAVIATIIFSTLFGAIAIIFSFLTKTAYYRGDLAKAKRNSERAQWFIIISIVVGVISIPFQLALMGLLG